MLRKQYNTWRTISSEKITSQVIHTEMVSDRIGSNNNFDPQMSSKIILYRPNRYV